VDVGRLDDAWAPLAEQFVDRHGWSSGAQADAVLAARRMIPAA